MRHDSPQQDQTPDSVNVLPSKHTPGPWRIEGDGEWIFSEASIEDGGDVICDPPHGTTASMARWAANARLIAAAPDLLAALQLLHDDIAEYARINNLGGFDNHDMKMARAAIARATGVDQC